MEVVGREREDYKEDEKGKNYNMGGYIIKLNLIDLRAKNNGV